MSALSGMTGFGRAGGEADWGSWTWEAKSVNGRGLDVRVNVPGGFEGLDQAVKKLANGQFTRGNMQISLRIEMAAGTSVSVDENALAAIVTAYEKANGGEVAKNTALATLMTIKGVVETGGSSGGALRALGQDQAVRAILLDSAMAALGELEASRLEEGASLRNVLSGALDGMTTQTAEAETHAGEHPGLIKTRLQARLKELDLEDSIDADRLAMEAAMTAAKADVREELDRLAAHIETGRGLLASGEPVGRKLDFLAQELNREANTLCSKSASLALTNAGLALKTLIDQFKEQAANVE